MRKGGNKPARRRLQRLVRPRRRIPLCECVEDQEGADARFHKKKNREDLMIALIPRGGGDDKPEKAHRTVQYIWPPKIQKVRNAFRATCQ